uniref:Uncharacterized protein n=1 Tax=Setaria italica TaxID=4555 RepID=K3XRP1_SETIT
MEPVCSSPRLKTKHRRKNLRLPDPPHQTKHRRKNLRLPDPPYPLPSDDAFVLEPIETIPSPDEHATGKRWRGEAISSVHYLVDPAEDTNIGDDVGQDKKIRPVSLRCSPSKFAELVAATDNEIKDRPHDMGFGGLLEFKPTILNRSLLTWLMDKFNLNTMKLELGSGKEIEINEHNEKLKLRTLAGDLAVRSFLLHAFCTLLFSNTDNYIRLDDVVWAEDLKRIAGINWCKAVVNSLRVAAQLYRLEKKMKGSNAPISWCGIFLIVQSVNFCLAFSTHATISQKSLQLRRCTFWSNRLRSQSSTCYAPPPVAAPVPAPAPAPTYAPAAAAEPSTPSSSTMDAPLLFNYPSFFSSFGQSQCELVGRSKNSQAEKILRSYHASTAKAQSMMRKAHDLTRTVDELMAKAHHE